MKTIIKIIKKLLGIKPKIDKQKNIDDFYRKATLKEFNEKKGER